MSEDAAVRAAYTKGVSHGGVVALEHLAANVAERIRHTEDPSSEGPTWLGLQQLLDQALAAARDFESRYPS